MEYNHLTEQGTKLLLSNSRLKGYKVVYGLFSVTGFESNLIALAKANEVKLFNEYELFC